MRRFTDNAGHQWEVVLGRASWGVFMALFVPGDGGAVREAPLNHGATEEATRALLEASHEELQAFLDRSTPRTE